MAPCLRSSCALERGVHDTEDGKQRDTGGKEAEQRLERSTRQSGLKAWGQGCFSLNKCKVKDTSFFFKIIFGSNLFEKKRQSNQVSPSNYVLLHTER